MFDEDEAAEFVEPTRGQVHLMVDKVLDGRPARCARSLVRPSSRPLAEDLQWGRSARLSGPIRAIWAASERIPPGGVAACVSQLPVVAGAVGKGSIHAHP